MGEYERVSQAMIVGSKGLLKDGLGVYYGRNIVRNDESCISFNGILMYGIHNICVVDCELYLKLEFLNFDGHMVGSYLLRHNQFIIINQLIGEYKTKEIDKETNRNVKLISELGLDSNTENKIIKRILDDRLVLFTWLEYEVDRDVGVNGYYRIVAKSCSGLEVEWSS